MNFTLELKNIPLSDKVAETWWQALWLPQGLVSAWQEPSNPRYSFAGADPEGFLHIEVWGRVPDPEGIQDYWMRFAVKDTSRMSPKEGETVIVDMAAGILSLPLLVVGGLAVAALGIVALKRR